MILGKLGVPHSTAAGDYSREAKASAEGGGSGLLSCQHLGWNCVCLDNTFMGVGNDLEIFLRSHVETLEKSLQTSINVDEHLKHLAIILCDSFLPLYEVILLCMEKLNQVIRTRFLELPADRFTWEGGESEAGCCSYTE